MARLIVGLGLAAHGAQKLFGPAIAAAMVLALVNVALRRSPPTPLRTHA
jgi:hypothetical protein